MGESSEISESVRKSSESHQKVGISRLYNKPTDYQGERINPHIGLLTKVIPFKLFLDIVPSSSTDITRALRGQPSDFLETTGDKMAGTSLYMF